MKLRPKLICSVFLIGVGLLSQSAHATCALSIINCPAYPSYTLADVKRIWLAGGNQTASVHTDLNACIRAGQAARNECKLEAPMKVVFSVGGQIVSETLIRRYQEPSSLTPISQYRVPAGACVHPNFGTIPNRSTVAAAPYLSAPINKACPRQSRACLNGVLSGSYPYPYTMCANGF